MYFMSDPQALHVTRNVIPGKLGVDLHLHRVHIPLVDYTLTKPDNDYSQPTAVGPINSSGQQWVTVIIEAVYSVFTQMTRQELLLCAKAAINLLFHTLINTNLATCSYCRQNIISLLGAHSLYTIHHNLNWQLLHWCSTYDVNLSYTTAKKMVAILQRSGSS